MKRIIPLHVLFGVALVLGGCSDGGTPVAVGDDSVSGTDSRNNQDDGVGAPDAVDDDLLGAPDTDNPKEDVQGTDTTTNPDKDLVEEDNQVVNPTDTTTEDNAEPTEDIVLPTGTVYIHLKHTYIEVDGGGVSVNGTQAVILAPGTYVVDGTLDDGQLVVNVGDSAEVTMILDNVTITDSTTSPISVITAANVEIIAKEGTVNTITDGTSYVFPDASTDEPNAALFSKKPLVISGAGEMVVHGNYNDGVASKDGLTLSIAKLMVTSKDDGLRGKDFVLIESGTYSITSSGDGIVSDSEEGASEGYITIEGGDFAITAKADGIVAQTDLLINGGSFSITSGSGANSTPSDALSTKGLKGVASLEINGGTFTLNCQDDAVHSNAAVTITDGTFDIRTGDDGVHSDTTVTINGGDFDISKSYEGVEATIITITGGSISVVSSDDGINVAGGDGSGGWGPPGGGTTNSTYFLYMKGGYVAVDAGGDGIDINGGVEMSAGTLLVNGPTANDNGALDYDNGFKMTGGLIVAVGSSGMAMAPSSTGTTQNAVLVNLTSSQSAGTLVNIQTSSGTSLVTFKPTKKWQSICFSSPELTKSTSYKLYTAGSSTGTLQDSLYIDGVYTPGNLYTTFTQSSTITKVGSGGGPGF